MQELAQNNKEFTIIMRKTTIILSYLSCLIVFNISHAHAQKCKLEEWNYYINRFEDFSETEPLYTIEKCDSTLGNAHVYKKCNPQNIIQPKYISPYVNGTTTESDYYYGWKTKYKEYILCLVLEKNIDGVFCHCYTYSMNGMLIDSVIIARHNDFIRSFINYDFKHNKIYSRELVIIKSPYKEYLSGAITVYGIDNKGNISLESSEPHRHIPFFNSAYKGLKHINTSNNINYSELYNTFQKLNIEISYRMGGEDFKVYTWDKSLEKNFINSFPNTYKIFLETFSYDTRKKGPQSIDYYMKNEYTHALYHTIGPSTKGIIQKVVSIGKDYNDSTAIDFGYIPSICLKIIKTDLKSLFKELSHLKREEQEHFWNLTFKEDSITQRNNVVNTHNFLFSQTKQIEIKNDIHDIKNYHKIFRKKRESIAKILKRYPNETEIMKSVMRDLVEIK